MHLPGKARLCGVSAVLATLALLGCGGGSLGDPAESISDIESLAELRNRFNADEGSPRLLLLMSPT